MPPKDSDHDRLVELQAQVASLQTSLSEQRASASELHAALQRAQDRDTANVDRRLNEVSTSIGKVLEQVGEMTPRKEWDIEHKVALGKIEQVHERLEERARLIDVAISEIRLSIIPRGEVKLLLDALTTRLDSTATQLAELGRLLTAVKSGAAGQQIGAEEVYKKNERTRAWVLGLAGLLLAVTSILVTVLVVNHKTYVPYAPPTTTTTVPSGKGP